MAGGAGAGEEVISRKEANLAHMSREDRRAKDDAMAKRRQFHKVKKVVEDEREALKPGGWPERCLDPGGLQETLAGCPGPGCPCQTPRSTSRGRSGRLMSPSPRRRRSRR